MISIAVHFLLRENILAIDCLKLDKYINMVLGFLGVAYFFKIFIFIIWLKKCSRFELGNVAYELHLIWGKIIFE